KDCEDRTILLGLFNLTLDPWPEVEFDLPGDTAVTGLERLAGDGRWHADAALTGELRNGRCVVRYARPVPFDEPLFVRGSRGG
ncbi:MAG: hypothetical protein WC708_17525, partial [Lentisphaeria bacterium]